MAKRRPSGDGMVRQKPNGDWEGRIVVGHKKNGDPIFRYVTDKNQKDFLQRFNQLKEEYRGVELTEDSNMTVGEWLDKWLTEYLPGTIRPQTVDRHRRIVNTYIRPHIGKKKLAFLSTNEVQRMYVKLKKTGRIKEHPVYGHELADNTIIDIHATLHRAMEIAVNNHLIPKNPTKATVKPKKKKKDLQVLNDAELDILMQAIDDDKEWGDFFYLELTTGLRRGEICGLRWRDFDEKEGVIRIKTSISLLKGGVIYEGEPKTDESKRKILLPKITAGRLRNRKRISEWIFPNLLNPKLPIAPPAAHGKAKSFLKKLNLPNISFHDLCHTFATTSVGNGMDIKTLSTILGHISSKTTIDIYLHSTGEMKKNAADKINARFSKGKATDENVQTEDKQTPQETKFEPKKGKMRKQGTGCISKINDHLYEGRYSPKDAYGKRMARNIYAPTREECEEKLAILIQEMKAEIAAQKAQLRMAQ